MKFYKHSEIPADAFVIPLSRMDAFKEKMAKLQKRAAKLGCDQVGYEILGAGERSHYPRNSNKAVMIKTLIIQVTGTAPKLAGWEFVAKIEFYPSGNVISPVPGASDVDERFRSTDSRCEHCNTKRSRKNVFIVRNDSTGEQKQVGRNCLADFTGIKTPEKIASQCQFLSMLGGEINDFMGGLSWENWLPLDHVLAWAHFYIRNEGWMSKGRAEIVNKTATAENVANHFNWDKHSQKRAAEAIAEYGDLTERDEAIAAEVIEWMRDVLMPKETKSDYEHNLCVMFDNPDGVFHDKRMGLVVSAVASMMRHKEMEIKRAYERKQNANSDWIGNKGERLRGITAKIETIKHLDSNFGVSVLHKFRTDDGNLISWFASRDHEVDIGDEVKFDGTVKNHREWNGIKETQMTRITFK